VPRTYSQSEPIDVSRCTREARQHYPRLMTVK
jgi:hypothetical protein